ncbi:hypothetical protein ACFVXC_37130 [Streptomyces sp. NPDC058257]|uniref:hypothetical protein n=1 Tax=Streptomyces sp. NPDC058257 TaxID=3346409 RepID=UPI0036E9E9C8
MRRGMRNVLGASTAALCLGGLLAACGSGDGDGYVATGPVGAGPQRSPGKGAAPTGDVELVPLDGSEASSGGKSGDDSDSPDPGGSGGPGSSGGSADKSAGGKSATDKAGSGAPATPDGDGSTADGAKPGRTPGNSSAGSPGGGTSSAPSSPSAPATGTGPSGPAKLGVGDPQRKPAADRWCEKVTVAFHNTGGSPVRSGTVTFGTHVIGALGVDWATLKSTEKLPAPIKAGKTVKKTWPVCVEAWRVPLGMHIETRDVSVKWE